MTTVGSLFHVHKGHQLSLNDVELADDMETAIAYVARSHRNNGVTAWVKRVQDLVPAAAGDISVCLRSRNHALSAFVQPRPFYTTYHVAILTPKETMTLREKLWWCLCIRANRFRFNFGRQANRTISTLVLPNEVPKWTETLDLPTHTGRMGDAGAIRVNTSGWGKFLLTDLFDLSLGEYTVRRDLPAGETPLVTASAWNNGITARIGERPHWQGGQITVANNGSVGAAFYQPRPFSASRDVTILNPKIQLSPATALFICAILRKESHRFNYARKWTTGRMKDSSIRLPSSKSQPDVVTMEKMIRTFPLGWMLS